MSSIFISYSRKDIEFARKIVGALAENDLDTWIDWQSIPKGEDWEQEIYRGIEGAETFIFLTSPDSAKSEICNKEIAHAIKNNKRIIPIIIRDTNPKEFHFEESEKEISRRNWIFCRDQIDAFDTAIRDTIETIQTDYDWVKYHTKLQVMALEWERNDHERSLLYRGKELENAEVQLATNASKEPIPTDLQHRFILKSRQATDRQRAVTTGIAIAGIISLAVLAIYGLVQANNATNQAATAQAASTLAVANEGIAIANEATAVANEILAEERAIIARAGELAAQSIELYDNNVQISMLLGIEAFHTKDTLRSRETLMDVTKGHPRIIGFLSGNGGPILSVTFSPDGKTIAAGHENGTITLWNVETRQQVGEPLTGHADDVTSIAFSPDGKILASGSLDDSIILWDVDTRRPVGEPLTGHTDNVTSIAFSPDGKILASGGRDNTIIFWNLESQPPVGKPLIGTTSFVYGIAFNPDGKTFAAINWNPTYLWDVETNKQSGQSICSHRFDGPPGETWTIAFSPDGKFLASGSVDSTIILCDMESGMAIGEPLTRHNGSVYSVDFSPDGRILASGSQDETIILWDTDRRLSIGEPLIGHGDVVRSVDFSPNGEILASGGDDGTIILWNVSTRIESGIEIALPIIQPLALDYNQLYASNSLSFSPDGMSLAEGTFWGSPPIYLWDVSRAIDVDEQTAYPASLLQIDQTDSEQNDRDVYVAFSPDGKTLAAGGFFGPILLWDIETRKPLGEPLEIYNGSKYSTYDIDFSPDGRTLAALIANGDSTMIIVWDMKKKQPIGQPLSVVYITNKSIFLRSLKFNSDGKLLAYGRSDGRIIIWNMETFRSVGEPLIGHAGSVYGLAFSPDGKTLASSGNDKTIILWNLETHQPIGSPLIGHTESVRNIAFSPDGRYLASGSWDTTIILWDIETRQPFGSPLNGHSYLITDITFSPDGKTLASGSLDLDRGTGTFSVILWDLDITSWIEKSCQRVGRNFTYTEWERYFPNEEYRKTCPQWPAGE